TTDSGNLSFDQAFQLQIASPTGVILTGNSVTAGVPTGTLVGVLSTDDPTPGLTYNYTLSRPHAAGFPIHGGRLETAKVFLDTTPTTLQVTIRSTSSLGLSVEDPFGITVNPSTTPPTGITLTTNPALTGGQPAGTVVGTLNTVDPNAGQSFTYEIVGGANADLFAIKDNTL